MHVWAYFFQFRPFLCGYSQNESILSASEPVFSPFCSGSRPTSASQPMERPSFFGKRTLNCLKVVFPFGKSSFGKLRPMFSVFDKAPFRFFLHFPMEQCHKWTFLGSSPSRHSLFNNLTTRFHEKKVLSGSSKACFPFF